MQCTADAANRRAIEHAAGPHHMVDTWEGLAHSAWSHQQASEIIKRTVTLICSTLEDNGPHPRPGR